jgi:chromate transport protein ChrA
MISLKVLYFILKSTFMAFGGGNALFPFMRQEAVVKNK